jgi:ABC-type methionine transport system permease subunit
MLSYTLTLAAAAEILKANVDTVEVSVAALVFAVLSGLLIAVPVVVVIFAPDRSNQVLASLRSWLLANTRSIALIVLMAIGGILVVRGAYDLSV